MKMKIPSGKHVSKQHNTKISKSHSKECLTIEADEIYVHIDRSKLSISSKPDFRIMLDVKEITTK